MSPDLLQMPLPGRSTYNEFAPDGVTPRPYWSAFIDSVQDLGPDELARRWERAERRIRENGVTYNVYTDPQGINRPLEIDPFPLLIPPEEWQFLEAGIIQRAQLLNLLLEDIYGRRELVRNGDLPAALLFANPAFLRPLTGLSVPQRCPLHLLGVDLARSPDGRWWVLADRTQSPSGTGYALQNRTIVRDVLPEAFRSANVTRLASFFRAQREALLGLAKCDNPRAVLLTPGPYNETYFEHSYLARYLGFTLVEGADLTVRGRRVYLKTVEGLHSVDVILRRVDDDFCDPLELRGDSFLGVAGLVEAVNAGNVVLANALGSGVVETAAIMPFLPGLSRKLLGEPLKLPSVATWWCGQDYALDWVLNHLESVVLKPAFPSRGMEPIFGANLSKPEQSKIRDQIRSRPYAYVAQEQVALSTAPVWDQGHLYPRSLVLRTYVLNTGFRLGCDAGRAGTRGRRRWRGGFHAARRAQQRRVGLERRPRRHVQHAAPQKPGRPTAARARRSSQPRGRSPVLAGTLRGAVGMHRAAVAVPGGPCPARQSRGTGLPVPAPRLFRVSAQYAAEGSPGQGQRARRRTGLVDVRPGADR